TLYFAATGRRAWAFDPRPKVTPFSEQRGLMRATPDLAALSPVQREIIAPLLAFDPARRGTAAASVEKILDALPESSGRHTDDSRARARLKREREADAVARAIEGARADERDKVAKRIRAERSEAQQLAEVAEREQAQGVLRAERAKAGEAASSVPTVAPMTLPAEPSSFSNRLSPALLPASSVRRSSKSSRGAAADRVATISLLALGSLTTLFALAVIPVYAFNSALPFGAHVAAWVVASTHVVLLGISFWFGLHALRRGRIAFWIPLVAGAVASVIFLACFYVIGATLTPR
ncbi:MAG: DUF6264 family protein, partial [Pseudolysinimonas sp.]